MIPLLRFCFFVSGAAGLLYEGIWAQRFSLLLGVDIYSHAAVLTAFMGGLALGSELAARWADRLRRPWLAYALLEAAIGGCGAAIPWVLPLFNGPLSAAYAAFGNDVAALTGVRFAVALGVLLVPTALMGATLPVMTVALRRSRSRLGEVVGQLYAINIAGAVVGIVLGGFYLTEAIGLSGTNWTAIALNLAAGGVALVAGRLAPAGRGSGAECAPEGMPAAAPAGPSVAIEMTAGAPRAVWIAIAAGVTGAAAMITQIGWTRIVSLAIGSSTYAFSLIVAAFLIGLAGGARLATYLLAGRNETDGPSGGPPDAARPWAMCCAAAAVLCWITIFFLGYFVDVIGPVLRYLVRGMLQPVPVVHAVLGIITTLFLLAPTIALGAIFPLACEAYAQRRPSGAARVTGTVYAINTIGAMAGSAVGGLVLVGTVGVRASLWMAAACYAVATAMAVWAAGPASRGYFARALRWPGVAAVVAAAAALVPWDPMKLLSAPFLFRSGKLTGELTFFRESPEGTVAVLQERDWSALLINGKVDASTAGDMPTQVVSGHLPMILHGAAREVAVIGLGSGVTLHSVLGHDVNAVDMIELSRAVVDAVRPPDGRPGPFDRVNGRSLDDPRVKLVVADGRNHIMMTRKRYDVIISEPSNPWIAGIASLFTREYFLACRERLRDDGVMCQWLQAYSLPPLEFYRVLRTIQEVFPDSSVWHSPGGNDFFILATSRARPAWDSAVAAMSRAGVAADLAQVGVRDPAQLLGLYLAPLRDLLAQHIDDEIGRAIDLPANTDDHNRLAFAAPRGLWQAINGAAYVRLGAERRAPEEWLPRRGLSEPERQALEDVQDFGALVIMTDQVRDKDLRIAFNRALRAFPIDAYRKAELSGEPEQILAVAERTSIAEMMLNRARADLERIRVENPAPEERLRLARGARLHAHIALASGAARGEALVALSEAYWRMGRLREARSMLDEARAAGASPPAGLEAAVGRRS